MHSKFTISLMLASVIFFLGVSTIVALPEESDPHLHYTIGCKVCSNAARIESLEARIDTLEDRIDAAKKKVKSIPGLKWMLGLK